MNHTNVLWICSDQQRWDTLGCYGNPFVHSPGLDGLAAEGVRFDRAYSQSPVCQPSRASFLTGRYPVTTRMRQNGALCPPDLRLVPKILQEAGYTCGLSGKLHLSAVNKHFIAGANPRTNAAGRAIHDREYRIDDGYDEFYWDHHPEPPVFPDSDYTQWLAAEGVTLDQPTRPDCRYVRRGVPSEHHQTTFCANKAIDFITRHGKAGTPWLFSVNMYDPHHPFDPPDDYLQRYMDRLDEIPLPNYVEGELADKPAFQRADSRGAYGGTDFAWAEMSEYDHRLVRAAYWAMCDHIDAQVARLIEALEATGQRENTIVLYHSDHGEMLGDHGIYLKGAYFYEPAIRVPLIVSLPGVIPAGRVSSAMVELTDLAPTLLDALGMDAEPGMQGRSLWPMLTGAAGLDTHRGSIYCEYLNAMPRPKRDRHYATMVLTDRYKLVSCHGLGDGELYDLQADPNESRNLWNDPDHLALKADMLVKLSDRQAQTADPLPERIGLW